MGGEKFEEKVLRGGEILKRSNGYRVFVRKRFKVSAEKVVKIQQTRFSVNLQSLVLQNLNFKSVHVQMLEIQRCSFRRSGLSYIVKGI